MHVITYNNRDVLNNDSCSVMMNIVPHWSPIYINFLSGLKKVIWEAITKWWFMKSLYYYKRSTRINWRKFAASKLQWISPSPSLSLCFIGLWGAVVKLICHLLKCEIVHIYCCTYSCTRKMVLDCKQPASCDVINLLKKRKFSSGKMLGLSCAYFLYIFWMMHKMVPFWSSYVT